MVIDFCGIWNLYKFINGCNNQNVGTMLGMEHNELILATFVNECVELPRTVPVADLYSVEKDIVEVVVSQVKQFVKSYEEKEKSDSSTDVGDDV